MHSLWQGLLANLAMVGSVIIVWSNVRDPVARSSKQLESIALGLAMGGGAVLAMSLAVPISPGMIFDLRAAPLAVAGFFGGPIAAVLAMAPALLFRVAIGGPGVYAGCLSIFLVTLAATLQHLWMRGRRKHSRHVALLALICASASLLSTLALPAGIMASTLLAVGLPSAFLNLLGVALAALLVLREENRRELMSSNALHRAIIDSLPDCLNVKDPDGRFMAANPATARLMRAASADELLGKTDFDFYPREIAQRFRADEAVIMDGGPGDTIEQQASFPDGSTIWLSTLKAPLRDRKGKLLGLITHNRDITQQKATATELQTTRQQFAEALEHMADGLVMYDRDARILICNNQLHQLFPATADLQVPGALLADILRAGLVRGENHLPPGMNTEQWIASVVEAARAGSNRVIPMPDGRFIAARGRPTANGGFLTVFSDVTADKLRERDLVHRAERDPLTGLANRSAFEARLAAMHQGAMAAGTEFSVMLIDLDRFKQVNDSYGHLAGDQLLVEVARRLEAACRQGDLIARLGGDEFALLSEGAAAEGGMMGLAQRVLDCITRPVNAGNMTLLPSCSIGFTTFPQDPGTPDTLVMHADRALYAAKALGRRKWVSYSERLHLQRQEAG